MSCCHVIYVLLLGWNAYKCTYVRSLKAKMEIEIPNLTSNGYYNVKKCIVVKSEFGSKTLQFGKISGQEKKIQVQLQVAEWERMKENYFSTDNVAANLDKAVNLSDKILLQLEEWISPEQNKYRLIKFVQRKQEAAVLCTSVKQRFNTIFSRE